MSVWIVIILTSHPKLDICTGVFCKPDSQLLMGGNQEDGLQRGNLLQTVIYQKGRNIATLYPMLKRWSLDYVAHTGGLVFERSKKKKNKPPPVLVFTHLDLQHTVVNIHHTLKRKETETNWPLRATVLHSGVHRVLI